ncbi:GvpL/GvpF family gas vesicle protein [Egicoccus sp. AB-alg2]|uniref:GvpL/GvpF family gas vesicle protein n=1 Tax=Egicoccus sp. AB-alg2 TaxID=3242693 RepID=UPI00359EF512
MSAEQELLRRLRAVLASSDVDADALVGEAWQEARDEVRAVLKRAFTHDLLTRVVETLEGAGSSTSRRTTTTAGSQPAAEREAASERQLAAQREPASEPAAPSAPAATTEAASPSAPAVPQPTGQHVTYVFGVVRAVDDVPAPSAAPQLPGGGPVRALDAGDLRALVCDLDVAIMTALTEPGPDGLDVLAAAALAHDEVLAAIAARQTVLPLRLGTVVDDDDAAVAVLGRHHDALAAELDRLDGRTEWAVTVRTTDTTPAAQTAGDDESPTADGRSYLQGRQRDLEARQRRRDARRSAAEEVHGDLVAHAVDAERIDRRGDETTGPPLLYGVYLVDQGSVGDFLASVEQVRAARPELLVEVSGPLPPYHFARFEEPFGT